MSRVRTTTLAAALLSLVAFAPAHAQTVRLGAVLNGAQEVPPNGSPATGVGSLLYNAGAGTIDVTLSFQGLTGTTTGVGPGLAAAHVHFAPPGVNGPIVLPLIGVPAGVMFFNNYARSFTFADVLATGVTAANVSNLQNELNRLVTAPVGTQANLYFNVHTSTFPGGEIRGNIAVVPEPSTYLLMGTGLASLGLITWRRRRVG